MSFNGFSGIIVLFVLLAIPISIITLIAATSSRYAHRKKQLIDNVIIAEYEPPEGLSPAEIGYLYDSRLGKTEMLATLLSLEQRQLVAINYSGFDGLKVNKLNAPVPQDLRKHESFLLRNLSTTQENFAVFYLKTMAGFDGAIIKSLAENGYIKSQKETFKYYALRTLSIYTVITAPIYFLLTYGSKDVGTFIFFAVFIFIFSFPFVIGLTVVAGIVYNKLVGQPGIWTTKLKTLWPQLEGYREYVRGVELDELQFESEDQKQRSKNKALPYAVALNLNTEWQKRF